MKSMRDFIELAEKEGELKRITAEVDWNLELSHIAKLNEEAQGPALLFENVKDYDTPVITSTCTSAQKLALILGMPKDTPLPEILRGWVNMGRNPISAVTIDKKTPPVNRTSLRAMMWTSTNSPCPISFPWTGGVLSERRTSSSPRIPNPVG